MSLLLATALLVSPAAKPLAVNPNPTFLSGGPTQVWSVAASPDGKLLAAGGGESNRPGFVAVWDVEKRIPVRTIQERLGILKVAFSPDGKLFAAVGWDQTVRVREVESGEDAYFMPVGAAVRVAFSLDAKLLATPAVSGVVRLWDAATGKELARLGSELTGAISLAFSPVRTILAADGGDGNEDGNQVSLWDMTSREQVVRLVGHNAAISGVAILADGKDRGDLRPGLSGDPVGSRTADPAQDVDGHQRPHRGAGRLTGRQSAG
jgi:WD40 repeat protein